MANLLNKLREIKMETAKRVGAAALAGALVLGGATGCAPIIKDPTDTNISGATIPEDNGKYSNLLMSVVNDEYYKSLVASTTLETNNNPALDPHPYAFLEDQGIDVSKILDGTYKASTMTFVYDDEPNNLYMNTRILIDDSYYQAYLLTYQLSDKEMADYRMVHGDKTNYSYSWPAFFINDKISETKQPTQVLSTQYTKKTHEVFQKKTDSYIAQKKDYILPSIDPSTNSYVYLEYPKHYNRNAPIESKQISVATFQYDYIENHNGIYEIPENFDRAGLIEKAKKNATTFYLQDSSLTRGKDFDALSNN